MQKTRPASKVVPYFGAFTTILLFAHTIKMVFGNTQRQTALFDLIAYFGATSVGFFAFLMSVPFFFRKEIKEDVELKDRSMTFYFKSFTVLLIGAGTGAGIMYGYLRIT